MTWNAPGSSLRHSRHVESGIQHGFLLQWQKDNGQKKKRTRLQIDQLGGRSNHVGALSEFGELACPAVACVRTIEYGQTTWKWLGVIFRHQKSLS